MPLLQLATSFRISACVVTSSAVVGSSAISSRGLKDERHRNHDPLALSPRELVRIRPAGARGFGQAHLEHVARALVRRCAV